MMREPAIGSYRDADGARHELVVRETADGGWQVLDLDLDGETAHVVDTLGRRGRPPAGRGDRPRLPDHRGARSRRRDGRPASPYLSKEEPMPQPPPPPPGTAHTPSARGCAAASGSLTGATSPAPLSPERHRALQLGVLHEHTGGLVELAAGARRDGRLQITTRRRADHFLPGGQAGGGDWLRALLELAACHADRGEEVFVAPPCARRRAGDKHAVSETRFLWVDVDRPGQLHALWAFLAERPCHLLVESGGPGACTRTGSSPSRCRRRG